MQLSAAGAKASASCCLSLSPPQRYSLRTAHISDAGAMAATASQTCMAIHRATMPPACLALQGRHTRKSVAATCTTMTSPAKAMCARCGMAMQLRWNVLWSAPSPTDVQLQSNRNAICANMPVRKSEWMPCTCSGYAWNIAAASRKYLRALLLSQL